MNNPLISIIVPVYNAEKTLNRCVDSIVVQTFTNWELLLINDGSKDHSGEICDKYALKDSRIRVFHKENGGVSSARNVGLDNARGEWITFIDSDDCIYDNVFNTISLHNEDLLIFNYDIKLNNTILCTECVPDINSYKIKDILQEYIYHLLFRTPWSKFFKRNLIKTLRFDIQITIGEDTLFVLQYIRNCRSVFFSDQIYYTWSDSEFLCKDKYKLSVGKAVYIVSCLYSAYQSLNIKCVKFETFIYDFYYSLCEDDLSNNGTMWFKNRVISLLWNNIKSSYSVRRRIMFFLKRYKFIEGLIRIYHHKELYTKK